MPISPKNAACIILIQHLKKSDDLVAPSEVARTIGSKEEDPDFLNRRVALSQNIRSVFPPDNLKLDENKKPELTEEGKFILLEPNRPKYKVSKWVMLLSDEDRRKGFAFLKKNHQLPAIYLLDAKTKDIAAIFEILEEPIQKILSNTAESNAQAALSLLRRPLERFQKEAPKENARAVLEILNEPLLNLLKNSDPKATLVSLDEIKKSLEKLRSLSEEQLQILESLPRQVKEVGKISSNSFSLKRGFLILMKKHPDSLGGDCWEGP